MQTLNDIRREAQALEIDVEVDEDGCLSLVKRGDQELVFYSLQSANSQIVIDGAWEWLQQYRLLLSDLDQIRSYEQPRLSPRRRNRFLRSLRLWCSK